MKDTHTPLQACRLFKGISREETQSILRCLSTLERDYEKNESVLRAGARADRIGIVLSGSVNVVKDDFWGNRTIIGNFCAGELFAEVFSFAGASTLPFNVVAADDASIMFIDYRKLITTCTRACSYHTALVGNMLEILAGKNAFLAQKIAHITHRTTREKLLSYLSAEAKKAGTGQFSIPFNRQELADYLSVDRSAMCTELGKLRDEGLLAFRKNRFELLGSIKPL